MSRPTGASVGASGIDNDDTQRSTPSPTPSEILDASRQFIGSENSETIVVPSSPTPSEAGRVADAYFLPIVQESIFDGDGGSSSAAKVLHHEEGGGPATQGDGSDIEDNDGALHEDAPVHVGWQYDTELHDGKIMLKCNWSLQTSDAIWKLLTSEGHGTLKRAGMTSFFRHAVKYLSTSAAVQPSSKEFFGFILKQDKVLNAKKAKSNKPFEVHRFI
jgi:hypothetical protein